jgi:hypothetical protein
MAKNAGDPLIDILGAQTPVESLRKAGNENSTATRFLAEEGA